MNEDRDELIDMLAAGIADGAKFLILFAALVGLVFLAAGGADWLHGVK